MSLPPGFLDELRTRVSLADIVGRKVTWDARKSNQGKGDMWASCPFHQEKSASFHVDDKQGFYYCFGCHAKGDAISFVRETENLGFMEAIEMLSRQVGMTMPARDPQAQAKADRRGELAQVMEEAVKYYRLQLKTGGAMAARDYLSGRGLGEATQTRFEMGWAPDSRTGLTQALTAKGIPMAQIVAAGLAAEPDGGGAPYDRFRGRIMFPIRDGRGRCIAFGGRSMDPNARAKYLNSPETELFDKGRSLYNHAPAREAAGKGQPLIVAEGYVDVIALSEAGFHAAVAPLGTAITEDQLHLMWRIHPEPIIALDGDKAGLRAAMRVIDVALPHLAPERSLRFCLLPEGLDPDDLIRQQGRAAMQGLLDQAQPLVALLWRRETEGKSYDSPERRTALDRDLRAALTKIADPSLRNHYAEDIRRLRQQLFAPQKGFEPRREGFRPDGGRPRRGPAVQAATKGTALGSVAAQGVETRMREALVLALILRHPNLLPEFESQIERQRLTGETEAAMLAAILDLGPRDDLAEAVAARIGQADVDKLLGQTHLSIIPVLKPGADTDDARMCLAAELAKLAAAWGHAREVNEAMEEIGDLADEGLTWRLGQATEARNKAERAENEDRTQYDIAPSGARISREEKSAFDQLLGQIGYAKGARGRRGKPPVPPPAKGPTDAETGPTSDEDADEW